MPVIRPARMRRLRKAGRQFTYWRAFMSSRRFSQEFKEHAVRQIVEQSQPVADVSERLGVSAHSLYKWIKVFKPAGAPGKIAEELIETRNELSRLQAQLRLLEEERDILQKAARYFARMAG
ncbi:transposase [Achromobacter sp. NPDC058515]|uniref:transposase n=1 Tax=Achromobacter sp. NPDC058515 TaxID=3346533 RepID=UPI00365585B3